MASNSNDRSRKSSGVSTATSIFSETSTTDNSTLYTLRSDTNCEHVGQGADSASTADTPKARHGHQPTVATDASYHTMTTQKSSKAASVIGTSVHRPGSKKSTIRPLPSIDSTFSTNEHAASPPVVACLELTQQVIPCHKSPQKAKNAVWLLVDIRCVPTLDTNSSSITRHNPGMLKKLNFDFYMPSGYETLAYCGAVERTHMTVAEPDNIWSVAICIGSTAGSGHGLLKRVSSSVSSTASMIDGFLKVLRAETHSPSKTAVQYRVNTLHSLFPAGHQLTVLKYCTLPGQLEKKASGQMAETTQATINRVMATADDDDQALGGLLADYEKWTRNVRSESPSKQSTICSRSRYSSLLPRPLSFKTKSASDAEPARI